ncbi:MAG: hypothetical protein ACR2MD_05895 [Aridibacter sp.]
MQFFADKPGDTFLEGLYYCSHASVIDGVTVISIFFIASIILNSDNILFYLLTAFLGGLAAIIFENVAFHLKLWSYKESMPIVPLLDVAILPFVQLILLVPLSIFLANKIYFRTS